MGGDRLGVVVMQLQGGERLGILSVELQGSERLGVVEIGRASVGKECFD